MSEELVPSGAWVPVVSSNVDAWKWDRMAEVLAIRFHNGGIYYYPGVDEAMVLDLMTAGSKGKWVHQNLVRPQRAFTRAFA